MAMEKITDPKFFSNNKNLIGKTLFVRHKGFNGTSPETDKRTICFPECYIIVGVNRIMPDQGRPIDYISGELGLHICPQDEYETFGFVSDVCIDYREDIFLKDEYWIMEKQEAINLMRAVFNETFLAPLGDSIPCEATVADFYNKNHLFDMYEEESK